MRIPVVHGTIGRRLLVNFRVEPQVLENFIPKPFRLKLVAGKAMAGICLLRLENLHPAFMNLPVGMTSENVAHRVAVEWDERGETRSGVFIPRRDTASLFNVMVGGRIFPGVHHRAKFEVWEQSDFYHIVVNSDDDCTHIKVEGQVVESLPQGSVFSSLAEASAFFKQGNLGYSPSRQVGRLDGLELHTNNWKVEPVKMNLVESSFFANRALFPDGSAKFDCALLMRRIEHEWYQRPTKYTEAA